MLRILYLILAGFIAAPALARAENITGAGASFPFPIYSTWAFMYKEKTGFEVNYQSVGSGAGLNQVTAGTVDFGGSDDPQTSAQLKKANLIQFPAVLGGVVVIVNLDGFANNDLLLSGKVLADIFHGKIKKWNDPAIAALNSGKKLPDATINVIYRADSSGTTAVFTEYLSQMSQEWKDDLGAAKSINWPEGVGRGAKGNEGMAGSVKSTRNSIGYLEFAHAAENKITWTSLVSKAGRKVEPSYETISKAAGEAKWDQSLDYFLWLVNPDGAESWPITAATYILIKRDNLKALANVTKFFDWCFVNGDKEAVTLQYVPLPESLKEDIRSYWRAAAK